MDHVIDDGVALMSGCDGAVRFGFSERTGGVSAPPFSSLNLGSHVGDDLSAVEENRRRLLAALGCAHLFKSLLVPNQVHGEHICIVRPSGCREQARVRTELAQGSDAVVCTAPDVPVLLCFADCAPVVLTAPRGFAVVHSGWKGTLARIGAKAACSLMDETGCAPSDIRAYIGPHILGGEYEVSDELMGVFDEEFGWHDAGRTRLLDLSRAIVCALVEVGLSAQSIEDLQLSTLRGTDRFFSYRAEHGTCGRHGAIAVMSGS